MRRGSLVSRVAAMAFLVAAVVGASFIFFLLAVTSLRRAVDRQSRSTDVTAAALRVDSVVSDFETGIRGYVETRQAASRRRGCTSSSSATQFRNAGPAGSRRTSGTMCTTTRCRCST